MKKSINDIVTDEVFVIKRNGSKEPFDVNKIQRLVNYATNNNEQLTQELLEDSVIKFNKEIKVTDMIKVLINTCTNKMSRLAIVWEEVAARLQKLEYYKTVLGISDFKKGINNSINLYEIYKDGVKRHIYHKDIIETYSEDDIKYLQSKLDFTRDDLFNFKGLVTFYDKYCLNKTKTKKLELHQITYMRVAMSLARPSLKNSEELSERLASVVRIYDSLSKHEYTCATPIMLNAFTPFEQLSSCVLNTVDDDTISLLDTGKNLGVYSKYKGGTALDISSIRSKGSFIKGTQGYTSGAVRFLQLYEKVMKAWNQGGKRPGALAVYFNWWTKDVIDILSLKSNGGTEENRARGLQYSIKMNNFLINKFIHNEDVYLFDPNEAKELIGKVGKDFEETYNALAEKQSISKVKINSRELFEKIFKERSETGNIYLFHDENVNEQSMLNRYIGSSNLCSEITLPSSASKLIRDELITINGKTFISKVYEPGEIALCNLSSINLEKWLYMNDKEKEELCEVVVEALDNTVDIARYPVKEGEYSNKLYRYLGIGVLNYANYLALKKIVIDSKEALEETDKLFDDLAYYITKASIKLAKEKGKFEKFSETKWADGIFPFELANEKAKALTDYEVDMSRWEELRKDLKEFGIRNATLMAVAPTSTSGKSINATESIEPIHDIFYKEEGTITLPTLVPNYVKNIKYYKNGFESNQYALVRNAAVRQKWIDQAQSVNIYLAKPDSLKEMVNIHLYGFDLGMKTFYYLKQSKEVTNNCDSCT